MTFEWVINRLREYIESGLGLLIFGHGGQGLIDRTWGAWMAIAL